MTDPKKETIKEPPAAGACQIIAVLSLILAGVLLLLVFTMPPAADKFSGVVTSLALIISSIFWFALQRIIILLAQIERNTRDE